MNKCTLLNDLRQFFMDHLYLVENQTVCNTDTHELSRLKYRTDSIFHAKVNAMVFRVLCIISDNEKE